MKIITTYREIMHNGCWEEFCIDRGLNEYCVSEGCDDQTEVELSLEEARKYGLIV